MLSRLGSFGLSVLLSGLVATAVAVVIIPAIANVQPVTITRNSMQAVIPLGSLAYIHAEPEYKPGDVITFRGPNGEYVTHAVIALLPNPANNEQDGLWLQTQGSSNAAPDPQPVNKTNVAGRVIFYAPVFGTVLKIISTPVVVIFLGLLAFGCYLLTLTGPKPTLTPATG